MLQNAPGKCFEKGIEAASSRVRRYPFLAPENQFGLKKKPDEPNNGPTSRKTG
jgi:hypothetical protein